MTEKEEIHKKWIEWGVYKELNVKLSEDDLMKASLALEEANIILSVDFIEGPRKFHDLLDTGFVYLMVWLVCNKSHIELTNEFINDILNKYNDYLIEPDNISFYNEYKDHSSIDAEAELLSVFKDKL